MVQKSKGAESLLEEMSHCRVMDVGVDGFAECLDVGPKSCPYALPFGYAFLCRHPRLGELIQQTEQARNLQASKN